MNQFPYNQPVGIVLSKVLICARCFTFTIAVLYLCVPNSEGINQGLICLSFYVVDSSRSSLPPRRLSLCDKDFDLSNNLHLTSFLPVAFSFLELLCPEKLRRLAWRSFMEFLSISVFWGSRFFGNRAAALTYMFVDSSVLYTFLSLFLRLSVYSVCGSVFVTWNLQISMDILRLPLVRYWKT